MFGLQLFVVVLFVSGLIAYVGDLLGRQIGKRRVSLLRLRPRHTGIIVSVFSGMMIALFTLTVLALVSQEARQAMFGMEKLRVEKEQVARELRKTTKELTGQTLLLEKRSRELEEKNQEVVQLRTEFDSLNEQVDKEKGLLAVTQRRLKQATRTQQEVKRQLSRTKQRLSGATSQIRRLEAKEKELSGIVEKLTRTRQSLSDRVEDLRRLGDEVFQRLKGAQEELEAVRKEKEAAIALLKETKEGEIIYEAGKVLAHVFIPARTSREAAAENVLSVLVELNEAAIARGARGRVEAETVVVYAKQLQDLLERIAGSSAPQVVRIICRENVVKGTPVHVQFQIAPNQKIFDPWTTLSEAVIDPAWGRDAIEARMLDLIQRAKEKAKEAGVVPEAADDITGVTVAEFTRLIDLMAREKNPLRVQVQNTEPVYTAGPLVIQFRVREAQTP